MVLNTNNYFVIGRNVYALHNEVPNEAVLLLILKLLQLQSTCRVNIIGNLTAYLYNMY